MNRNYHNCEMVKVDQNEFDEIMSKRVTMLSSLEEWTLEHIRMFIFRLVGKHNSCFCDGLSTTCLMAGSNEAMRIVKMLQKKYPEKNIEALFIDRKDNITVTDGMKLNPVE